MICMQQCYKNLCNSFEFFNGDEKTGKYCRISPTTLSQLSTAEKKGAMLFGIEGKT